MDSEKILELLLKADTALSKVVASGDSLMSVAFARQIIFDVYAEVKKENEHVDGDKQ